jgi:MscS family membrane protein
MVLLSVLVLAGAARADDAAPSTTTPSTTATTAATLPGGEDDPGDLGFTSPRSTMRGYLLACRAGDFEKAARHLDLRRLPKGHSPDTGPLFARQLKTALDRTLWVDLDELSESPDGERDDGLTPRRDLVGVIRTTKGSVDVVVERVPDADGTAAWKIASSVVARIPELYAEYGDGPLANLLPDFMLDVSVLELRLWQWVALAVVILGGALLAWLATGPLLRLLAVIVPADRRHQSERLLGGITGPVRLLIVIVTVAAATPWLVLSVPAAAGTALARTITTTIAITWLWLRIVDVVAAIADDRLRTHGRAGAVSVIPLGRRTLKIFVAVMAGIAIVQNLGYDATGILAGLGVGGLALALAAQKTVENLLGGAMLITDQPVRVGDLCRFGTRTGTVEDIGLRSTRIRTPERSVVAVPNAEFATTQIENLALRDRMWLSATIGLRLDTTTTQLRAVLDALRTLLDAVPRVDRGSASVRLVGLTPIALEVLVSAYILTRSADEFVALREEFFLQALDAIDAHGSGLSGRPFVVVRSTDAT